MMKNLIYLIFLGVSPFLFAFFRMEPCYQNFDVKNHDTITVSSIRPLKNSRCISHSVYMFLYDRNTGYSIGSYIPENHDRLNECTDFFKCKKEVDTSDLLFFILQENKELIVKKPRLFRYGSIHFENERRYMQIDFREELNEDIDVILEQDSSGKFVMKDRCLYPIKNAYITKGWLHLYNRSLSNCNTINILEYFSPQPGVFIENKNDKVFINDINFQDALIKYYFNLEDKQRIIAESIKNLEQEGTASKASYDLWKVIHENRSKEEKELLEKSKIIEVYAVMKGQHGNHSIVWGKAVDQETAKPFHWLTDLKADISTLVKYYNK